MWYGNFPVLHGMYLNFREYGLLDNYLYMIPILFVFVVVRYALIFYYDKNLQEQPEKVQLIIEHDLHHDISYTSENRTNSSSDDDSLNTPLLSNQSLSANTEFNSIYNYFSEDSEDLVLQRRQSVNRRSVAENTPVLPVDFQEQEILRRQLHKQKKHEIHQKVRWYKLLFQVAKILKW